MPSSSATTPRAPCPPRSSPASSACAANAPVVVDPKHRDFTRYRGATTITPNLRELEVAAGHSLSADDTQAIAAAARPLIEAARLQSMVVTLGSRGMLVVPAQGAADRDPEHPARGLRCHGRRRYGDRGAGPVACRAGVAPGSGAARERRRRRRRSAMSARWPWTQPASATLWRRAGRQDPVAQGAGGARRLLAHRRQAHRLHQRLLRPAARRTSRPARTLRRSSATCCCWPSTAMPPCGD